MVLVSLLKTEASKQLISLISLIFQTQWNLMPHCGEYQHVYLYVNETIVTYNS